MLTHLSCWDRPCPALLTPTLGPPAPTPACMAADTAPLRSKPQTPSLCGGNVSFHRVGWGREGNGHTGDDGHEDGKTTTHRVPWHVQMFLELPISALGHPWTWRGLGPAEQGDDGEKRRQVTGGHPGGITSPRLFRSCSPCPAQEPVYGRCLALAEDEAAADPLLSICRFELGSQHPQGGSCPPLTPTPGHLSSSSGFCGNCTNTH